MFVIRIFSLFVFLFVISSELHADMIESVAGIKIGDDISTVLPKVKNLKEEKITGSTYNKECGYSDIQKYYNSGDLEIVLFNDKVAYISYSKRIPGSITDIELSIINKYGKPIETVRKDWGQIDLIYSRSNQKRVSIQNFSSKDPTEGIYIILGHNDSTIQSLYREKDDCIKNHKAQKANPNIIPDL